MSNWQEYVGYLASALVVLSFMVGNNITKIRWINMLGCISFVVYGFLINSLPVMITNIFITIIQIYYLFFKKN